MIRWIGTLTGILGAILVAGNFGYQSMGYASFLIGSTACFYSAFQVRDNPSMVLWGFFSLVNCYGLFAYYG